MADWRSDPGWRLSHFDPEIYTSETAPPTPVAAAELAPEKLWASEFRRGRRDPVATWFRELPIEERVRAELARRTRSRVGELAPRRDVR